MSSAIEKTTDKEKRYLNSYPRIKEFIFTLKRFLKNPLTIIGLTIIFIFVAIAVFAPVLAPPEDMDDPYKMPHDGWKMTPSPPNEAHPFGTLEQQYDIYYGIIWGTRNAFKIGIFVVAVNLIVGLVLGAVAGYFGGLINEVIMRITDMFYALPFIVVSMILVIILGRGINAIILVLIIFGWPTYARVIRGDILTIKESDYILAARASGSSHLRIIVKHLLPNSIYSVIVIASMSVGTTVLTAAALSFLGLGADSGYADWGQMVAMCRDWIVGPPENRLAYWYVVFIPGFTIALFVLGWNLLGDAVRDIFDPKMRRK